VLEKAVVVAGDGAGAEVGVGGKVCGGRCVLSGTAVHQDSSAVLVELVTVLR
jgi:hypothetical protein